MEQPGWFPLFSMDLNADSEVPTGTQYIYAVLPYFEDMMLKPQNHSKQNPTKQFKLA